MIVNKSYYSSFYTECDVFNKCSLVPVFVKIRQNFIYISLPDKRAKLCFLCSGGTHCKIIEVYFCFCLTLPDSYKDRHLKDIKYYQYITSYSPQRVIIFDMTISFKMINIWNKRSDSVFLNKIWLLGRKTKLHFICNNCTIKYNEHNA